MRTITFTGHLDAADGSPAVGWVRVAALDSVPVPEADTVISTQPVELQLGKDAPPGSFSTDLVLPTDLGAETPVLVEVHQLLEMTRPKSQILNVQTQGNAIDLADAPEVVLYPADQGMPAVPWSAVGRPGGVAPLGANGLVPVQFLPAGGGGSGGLYYPHHQEVAQAVWPVPHMLGVRPSSVSAFSEDWATEYDGFAVHHVDENNLLIEGDTPVAGYALIGI
jgi:hypothetical protein